MTWSEVRIGGGSHRFRTTRWSLIATAGGGEGERRRALEELCDQYWPPVYAFARGSGSDADRALDLTQGFFADLLARESLARADQERGRFRTFLLSCFTNYVRNLHDQETAQKRGGGRALVSLDAVSAEREHGPEPRDESTPEKLFERCWARQVLARGVERVREEYERRNRGDVFAALVPWLEEADVDRTYADQAAALGMSESAVKVTVHRMRQRFREALIEEVGQTIDAGGDVQEELKALLSAFA